MYTGLLHVAKCDVIASFGRSALQMLMHPFSNDEAWTVVLLIGCCLWYHQLSSACGIKVGRSLGRPGSL